MPRQEQDVIRIKKNYVQIEVSFSKETFPLLKKKMSFLILLCCEPEKGPDDDKNL